MRKLLILTLILIFGQQAFSYPGKVVHFFSTPGHFATGLTYDGKYLWLADRKTDLLYQLDTQTGRVIKTLKAPGYWIKGLAWDGQYLWATDDRGGIMKGDEFHAGVLYKIDPKDGTVLATIDLPFNRPQDLAWDGKYLWVIDAETHKLIQFDQHDGTTIKEFQDPAGHGTGLTFDGEYLWVADHVRNELYMVEPKTGLVLLITKTPDEFARGLAWDGKTLWISDSQADKVFQVVRKDDEKFITGRERIAQLTFTHEAMNYGPGLVKSMDIYIAIPRDRINQKIQKIEFSKNLTDKLTDQWGQQVAHYHFENIKPGQRVEAVMTVTAKMYDVNYFIFPDKVGTLSQIPENLKQTYLIDEDKYQFHSPIIQKAVKQAVGEEQNVYWVVRKIFDYVRKHLYYERVGGWNTAPTVLARGNGSCSEYSFVFISMCRAAGVPARYVGSVAERSEATALDDVYHRWVEVYMPGYGWVPIDPSGGDQKLPADQARFFGHLSRRFLITTQGGGGSKFMDWTYNSNIHYVTEPQTFVVNEAFGDWQPIYK